MCDEYIDMCVCLTYVSGLADTTKGLRELLLGSGVRGRYSPVTSGLPQRMAFWQMLPGDECACLSGRYYPSVCSSLAGTTRRYVQGSYYLGG